MIKASLLAAGLAVTTLCVSLPAQAQNYPMDPGSLMEVTGVHLEDGADYAYADFLSKTWRKSQEFAKSKGWITDYKVYSNAFPRDGEPNLYLVVWFPDIPDAAEAMKRQDAFRTFMKQSDAELSAASGDRAKWRRIGSQMLLTEMKFK